jgi:hypothetical protein
MQLVDRMDSACVGKWRDMHISSRKTYLTSEEEIGKQDDFVFCVYFV